MAQRHRILDRRDLVRDALHPRLIPRNFAKCHRQFPLQPRVLAGLVSAGPLNRCALVSVVKALGSFVHVPILGIRLAPNIP